MIVDRRTFAAAQMGQINPNELITEAKLNGLELTDVSKYYTNDLIADINTFDADKIRASAATF